MSQRKAFEEIPAGATIEVWTVGDSGSFTTIAGFGPTGEPKEEWPHDKIYRHEGSKVSERRVVKEGRIYKIWFRTVFLGGDTEMAIHTRITLPKADGTTEEIRRHTWEVPGKKPETLRHVLVVFVNDDLEPTISNLDG